jgi:predicted DNA-binding transcriptional regulator YafY
VRADRLVAILLMLQVHGQLTAAELATQFETSERTIRRDLEALCMAGVPLYAQRGRGGGWALLGGHRIDLTGLTADEAQALFLATETGSAAALGPGMRQGLTAARLKLMAALPGPLRAGVEAASTSVLVDPSRWGRSIPDEGGTNGPSPDDPHLSALRTAVLSGLQVVVGYEPPGRSAEDRRLHPHGLVCKRGVWYLVATAAGGLRTYRVSRVRSVELTDQTVERPADFDLVEAWAGVQHRLTDRMQPTVDAQVKLPAASLRRLRATVGSWWSVEETGVTDDGNITVTIRFPSVVVAARELASWADQVEVVAPESVRAELADTGLRLLARYNPG